MELGVFGLKESQKSPAEPAKTANGQCWGSKDQGLGGRGPKARISGQAQEMQEKGERQAHLPWTTDFYQGRVGIMFVSWISPPVPQPSPRLTCSDRFGQTTSREGSISAPETPRQIYPPHGEKLLRCTEHEDFFSTLNSCRPLSQHAPAVLLSAEGCNVCVCADAQPGPVPRLGILP